MTKALYNRIYTIHKGKVYSLEVKETAKYFIADQRKSVFDYLIRFRKNDCSVSIIKAFKKEIALKEKLKEKHEEELHKIVPEIESLSKELNLLLVGNRFNNGEE